jgi:hypothetical protein
MKIGYGKIGRSMPLTLEKCGTLGGDVEMVPPIRELALRHPDDEFILVGRNTGEDPKEIGLPSNITNPWIEWGPELRRQINAKGLNHPNLNIDEHFIVAKMIDDIIGNTFEELDGLVLWIGQHGTSNRPLPGIRKDGWTKPQDWCAYYSGFLMRGANRFRDADPFTREEIYLNADSRNYLKMRDLAWPLENPVLTQFNFEHTMRYEREDRALTYFDHYERTSKAKIIRDPHIWEATVQNVYSRLEINGLQPGTPFGDLISFNDEWENRGHFGLFINEAASNMHESRRRATALRDWVLLLNPTFVHGTWSRASQEKLNRDIVPVPWEDYFNKLHSVRCTFTTPSSGSGYATTKPWEAFAAGTVCFFHPLYDTQNNILNDAEPALKEWLRVKSPEELEKRVDILNQDKNAWLWLVHTQRAHFENAMSELRYMKMIEDRIYG